MFESARSIWRISAVRQALSSALLFVVITGIVAAAAFFALQNLLLERVDANLASRADTLLANTPADGAATRAPPRLAEEEDSFSVFLVAGDISPGPPGLRSIAAGYSTIANFPDEPGNGEDDESASYRVLALPTEAGTLVVAESLHDTEESVALIAGALFWGGLFAAGATLVVGGSIGLVAHRRIRTIETGLTAIAGGELERRLPVSGRGDDIDRLATSTNLMLTRLQSSVTALRDLSANIAHDLKTPIARLHQRLLQMRAEAGGEALQEEMDEAAADAARIGDVFDAVLRISQIEAGARRERFTEVDLVDIVNRTADLFRAVAEDERRPLQVHAAGAIPITGDADLLIQAASNLLANAFRHTPPSTPVEIRAASSPDGAMLTVSDRGQGIDASERQNVLRRFYRVDKSRTEGGAGLGLALVKAVGDLHGADIALGDNAPGLVVSLTFPYNR